MILLQQLFTALGFILLIGILDASRGNALLPRLVFAGLVAFLLKPIVGLDWAVTAAGVWFAWHSALGAYAGAALYNQPAIKGEVEWIDKILKPLSGKISWFDWGILAMSIRGLAYSAPLFLWLENPLWVLMALHGPIFYVSGQFVRRFGMSLEEESPYQNPWRVAELLRGLVFGLALTGGVYVF